MKILAIQFRYLGDAVLLTPALHAIKQRFKDCRLHLLVAEEIIPVLKHLPWLEQVWAFPRTRGKANLKKSWPILRALRQEHFDWSVDFSGSDRGALVSLLCGARERLAPFRRGGFLGRRFCYTRTVPSILAEHQSQSNFGVLSIWGITAPSLPVPEICADPSLAEVAARLFPRRAVLCHVATSQSKKEWPLKHWSEFQRQAAAAGYELVFCAGPTVREQELLREFRKQTPTAQVLPALPQLSEFIAVLGRARAFVTGDTGPLHLAAGLGIPTVSLFGPSSSRQWAPRGPDHRILQGIECSCSGNTAVCISAAPCMANISPEQVLKSLQELL